MKEKNLLPTCPELARIGVEDFKQTAKKLQGEARRYFLSREEIRRCFVGTAPQVGDCDALLFGRLEQGNLRRIEDAMDSVSDNYLRVVCARVTGCKPPIALTNIRAVRQVIENYPDLFPIESQDNIRNWLNERASKNMEGRNDYDLRQGLLSGFPFSVTLKYSQRERSSRVRTTTIALGQLIVFGGAEEDKYLQALNRIYLESGIDKVAAELAIEYGLSLFPAQLHQAKQV